jgi:hypothetical protein
MFPQIMGVNGVAKALSVLAVFGVLSGQVNASPIAAEAEVATADAATAAALCTCTKPIIRKEW